MGYFLWSSLKAGCTPLLNRLEKASLLSGKSNKYFHVSVLYFSGNSPNYFNICLSLGMLNYAI